MGLRKDGSVSCNQRTRINCSDPFDLSIITTLLPVFTLLLGQTYGKSIHDKY